MITIGALLGMAAHLESKGCSVFDQTGLAQKGGVVVSHVRIAARPDDITTTRIANGAADLDARLRAVCPRAMAGPADYPVICEAWSPGQR